MTKSITAAHVEKGLCAAHLQAFIDELKKHQIDYKALLKSAEIDPLLLNEPLALIDMANVLNFIELSEAHYTNQCLGLISGAFIHMSGWGILSNMMLSCATIGEASRNVLVYEPLFNSCIRTQQVEKEGLIYHQIDFPDFSDDEKIRHIVEFDFSAIVRLAEFLTNNTDIRNHLIVKVCFKHKAPNNIEIYKPILGNNIEFSCRQNILIFDKKVFDLPIVTANKETLSILLNQAENTYKNKSNMAQSIIDKINMYLTINIPHGKIHRKQVCQYLNISASTLSRRLQDHNVTFRELHEAALAAAAKDMLKSDHTSLQEIAFRLGYNNASAFNYAFKNWTGCTPSQYQKSIQKNR